MGNWLNGRGSDAYPSVITDIFQDSRSACQDSKPCLRSIAPPERLAIQTVELVLKMAQVRIAINRFKNEPGTKIVLVMTVKKLKMLIRQNLRLRINLST